MDNPRRTAQGKRLREQVLAEETDCHLCGKPVDKTLTVQWGSHGARCKGDGCPGCTPHPDRAEVDHVVPISRGGDPYERANAKLSHRHCNNAKRAGRPVAPAPPNAWPISDTWGGIFDTLR